MISVIIPTLNEQQMIGASVRSVLSSQEPFEIIVADGGSTDNTRAAVRSCRCVRLVVCERGRAIQMNAGALAARGDILLFLHADTRLPGCALRSVAAALADPAVAGGCFRLRFDLQRYWLKIFALFARINHILFTYGDQGLFMRARTFKAIGGFEEIPLMEDVEIQRRLRSLGRFLKLRLAAVTSARRFMRHGIVRQQARNTALVGLYHLGVSPQRLRCFYR